MKPIVYYGFGLLLLMVLNTELAGRGLHCHRLRTYCVYYRRGRDARVQESVAQLEQHQDRYLANANIG